MITDQQGQRLGYVDGKQVDEISGSNSLDSTHEDDTWDDTSDPVYDVVAGAPYTITIDGSSVTQTVTSSVTIIGPGYDLAVDDIKLNPGDEDVLALAPGGNKLTYVSSGTESPDLTLGVDGAEADYSFLAKGVEMEKGGSSDAGDRPAKG